MPSTEEHLARLLLAERDEQFDRRVRISSARAFEKGRDAARTKIWEVMQTCDWSPENVESSVLRIDNAVNDLIHTVRWHEPKPSRRDTLIADRRAKVKELAHLHPTDIARQLGVAVGTVRSDLQMLGITPPPRDTRSWVEPAMAEYAAGVPVGEIAAKHGLAVMTIRGEAATRGIYRPENTRARLRKQ